jgi:phosphate ABC transporter phosphate-binding protein
LEPDLTRFAVDHEFRELIHKATMKVLSQVQASGLCFATYRILVMVFGLCAACGAQRVSSLSQVRTLYIESFSGGSEAGRLHESLVRHLTRSRFKLVQSPRDADAIVRGDSQVWVRGYIEINPRTPSTDREAVYAGYLSLEVVDANGQPLWSWLVTPSRHAWSNIVDDLAGHAAKKLIEDSASGRGLSVSPTTPSTLVQTSLSGAGASFPVPLYMKWFEDFERIHPGLHIHYSSIGSQLGDEKLVAGKLDFAGSDVVPEVAVSKAGASDLRRFATVLGAVVPIYNIRGVTQDLRFTPETLADIYLGRVRNWDDPEIRSTNKGVKLPNDEIVVIHRSDGSGTSWVWSDFLSKVSPAWSSSVGHGTTLHWPTGMGAERNEGVASAVKGTPNSIGYVELTYAIQHQISFGAVRNRAGEYIRADYESVAEAARVSGNISNPVSTITDSNSKGAYPIAAFTWLVLPVHTIDPVKRAALDELLRWALTVGQKDCAALGYVPIPRETADRQLRLLNGTP